MLDAHTLHENYKDYMFWKNIVMPQTRIVKKDTVHVQNAGLA